MTFCAGALWNLCGDMSVAWTAGGLTLGLCYERFGSLGAEGGAKGGGRGGDRLSCFGMDAFGESFWDRFGGLELDC